MFECIRSFLVLHFVLRQIKAWMTCNASGF